MSADLQFEKVAVIGAGTMGAGIALVCARAGSTVSLCDISQDVLDRGTAGVRRFLDRAIEKGKAEPAERDAVLARIEPTLERPAAAEGAQLVIEAVPEVVDLKNELFREIADLVADDAVLATNTSSLSLAKVFAGVVWPVRCVGMHFFNPPPLMPLLEIVRTADTSADVLERVTGYARRLGKEPILVMDSPGFATSRLGVCLGLEAIRMVEAGVAGAVDIDKAMELGYRHPMGPLRLTDLVGLDVRMAIADYLRKELGSPVFEVPRLMRDMVARGKLGKKSGEGFYRWDEA